MSAAVVIGVLLEVAAGVCAALNARLGAYRPTDPGQGGEAPLLGRRLLLQALSVAMAAAGLFSMREDLGWWGLALGLAVLLVTASLVAVFLRQRARARR